MSTDTGEPPTDPPNAEEERSGFLESSNHKAASIIGVLSAVGLAIYALLNYGYSIFYSPLGLAPEDLDIDQTYILARSVSFVPLVLAFAALSTAGGLGVRIAGGTSIVVRGILLSGVLLLMVGFIYGGKLDVADAIWFVVVVSPAFVYGLLASGALDRPVFFRRLGLIATASTTSAVIIYAMITASAQADRAILGRPVEPIKFYPVGDIGFVILDIQASECRISWTGPDTQRPTEIFPDRTIDALYLGQSTTVAYFLSNGRTVRVQAKDVAIETVDG